MILVGPALSGKDFLDSALGTAMDLRVQLSSCVPATNLETSGARLTAADLVAHRGPGRPAVVATGVPDHTNHPTGGGVREGQGPMEALRASLKAQPPPVFDRYRIEDATLTPSAP